MSSIFNLVENGLDTKFEDLVLSEDDKYKYNGIVVPRVTDIIGKMIHEDFLMIWSNNIGFKGKRYKTVLEEAANVGSKAHDLIEQYLKTQEIKSDFIPFLSFKLWWDIVNKNNDIRIIGSEESLVCPWFGGTYDLLLEINGKIYLVDFKTSNYMTYKYFIQLSAYRYMIKLIKNIDLDGCLILKLNKHEVMFEEYLLEFSDVIHYNFIESCAYTFFTLVYAYYHVYNAQNVYNQIFQKGDVI